MFSAMAVLTGCAGTPQQAATEKATVETDATRDSAAQMCDVFIKHAYQLPNKRISVVDFTGIDGSESREGKLLAEQIISRLSTVSDLKVIERKQLNKVFDEQKLGLTGVTVEDEHKVGRILNVDAIISGTIAHAGGYEEINARMIDSTSGEIYCAFNHRRKSLTHGKAPATAYPSKGQPDITKHQKKDRRPPPHPTMHHLKEEFNRQLAVMRRGNPRRYDETVRTLRELEGLRRQRPRAYLLATEPPGSPHVHRAIQKHPGRAGELASLRQRLQKITGCSPSYRKIVWIHRQETMHRVKGKPYRRP